MGVEWGGCGGQTLSLSLSPSHLPGNDKKDAADAQVGQQDVDPNVGRHGAQEGEEAVVGDVGLAVQDADAHVHEGLGEVHRLVAHVGDGEGSHRQVGPLEGKKNIAAALYVLRGGGAENDKCFSIGESVKYVFVSEPNKEHIALGAFQPPHSRYGKRTFGSC